MEVGKIVFGPENGMRQWLRSKSNPAITRAATMNKHEKCCDFGEFKCTVPMPLNGRLHGIDFCVADIVAALNAANIPTVASCCGHGKIEGNVVLEDGRELKIKFGCR